MQVDADGKFVPARQPRTYNEEERLDDLFDCIKKSGRTRIILYVHGGRVSLGSALKTAKRLSPIIAHEEKDAYPIFFCWDSEQFSSYFRHLAYERNGVSYRGSYAAAPSALVAPLVLGADLGRGVTRLPINTTLSLSKLTQNFDLLLGRQTHLFPVRRKYEEQLGPLVYPKTAREAIKEGFVYDSNPSAQKKLYMAVGRDAQHYRLKFAVQFAATLPFQFTTEPIIDSVGTPAWGNMLRRTRSMFHLSQNYVSQPQNHVSQRQPDTDYHRGAGTMFFKRLREFLNDRRHRKTTLEVYAHSMGAIVINEAYAQFPDLPAKQIVFMAAACSIRDFANTTGEYIANSKTPFYNLSLHPRAELDDVEAFGLPVRGSLLAWIDEFFEDPKSFGDRTLGTFENIIIAQDFLPNGVPIYLKAFPIEDGTGKRSNQYRGPQRHGEFDNYYFWREKFRSTALATDYYEHLPKEATVLTPCGKN